MNAIGIQKIEKFANGLRVLGLFLRVVRARRASGFLVISRQESSLSEC